MQFSHRRKRQHAGGFQREFDQFLVGGFGAFGAEAKMKLRTDAGQRDEDSMRPRGRFGVALLDFFRRLADVEHDFEAHPVRILASERTRELVCAEVACRSLGDFPLKGLPQPVRVYAIRGLSHGS